MHVRLVGVHRADELPDRRADRVRQRLWHLADHAAHAHRRDALERRRCMPLQKGLQPCVLKEGHRVDDRLARRRMEQARTAAALLSDGEVSHGDARARKQRVNAVGHRVGEVADRCGERHADEVDELEQLDGEERVEGGVVHQLAHLLEAIERRRLRVERDRPSRIVERVELVQVGGHRLDLRAHRGIKVQARCLRALREAAGILRARLRGAQVVRLLRRVEPADTVVVGDGTHHVRQRLELALRRRGEVLAASTQAARGEQRCNVLGGRETRLERLPKGHNALDLVGCLRTRHHLEHAQLAQEGVHTVAEYGGQCVNGHFGGWLHGDRRAIQRDRGGRCRQEERVGRRRLQVDRGDSIDVPRLESKHRRLDGELQSRGVRHILKERRHLCGGHLDVGRAVHVKVAD
mmetsp:Transcript_36508/g.116997  ORF Transcript_36508/g.116997 Transcript_36508/m.116997 type:complete len:407 (-) Transcript_36508:672-1892(-)